jgi:hypothetical protein
MSSRSDFTQSVVSDLDAAGTKVNFLYYATDDVRINSVEVDSMKKYQQALTSLNFGGTSQVTVPSSDSISDTYLHLQLPPLADTNIVLSEGWAYSAIRSINYTWGSSTISTVELNSESLWSHAMLSAETSEKRHKMLQLGGAPLATGDDRTVGPSAVISLGLPWSTIRKTDKLGYDASLLSDPIIIQITLNDANHFMSAVAGSPTYPSAFAKGQVILKQGVLSNKADSMRNTLNANSNLLVSYPFIHKQTGTNTLIPAAVPGEPQEVQIQSLIASDLLGISFMVVPSADKRSGAATNMANKFNTTECQDIQLLYNGQVMQNLPWRLAELAILNLDQGSGTTPKVIMNGAGAAVADGEYFVYYLPFSYLKEIVFDGQFSNVSRYANQTMSIVFSPQNSITENLSFTCTYYYNALCTTQAGTSRITFS